MAAVLSLCACASAPVPKPAKLALVVGNAAYAELTPLQNPEHDAQDVCEALRRLGFEARCYLNVRDVSQFNTIVTSFIGDIGPQSAAVFYYSGHGVQAGGQNYLVPTDASVSGLHEDPLSRLYPLNALFGGLRQKPSAFQMIVLDACRSDPFVTSPPAGIDSRGVVSKSVPTSRFVRSLEAVARASYGTAPINDAPVGTIVLYATASKDTAYDGDGRNGPLTKYFLINVAQRGQHVEDLMKNIISGVQDETRRLFGKQQTPFVYQSFRNRYCFADCFDPNNFQVPPTN